MNNNVRFTKWNIVAAIMGIIVVLFSLILRIAGYAGLGIIFFFPFTNYIVLPSVVFLCVVLFMKKHNFLLLIPFAILGLLTLFLCIISFSGYGIFHGGTLELIANAGVCVLGYFVLIKNENKLVNKIKKLWFLPAVALAIHTLIDFISTLKYGDDITAIYILVILISPIAFVLMYLFVCKWIITPGSNESKSTDNTVEYAHIDEDNRVDYTNIRSNDFERENNNIGDRNMSSKLIKSIAVPAEQIKKTTLASNLFYSTIDIYENKVVGSGKQTMTWFFKNYNGIDFVKANMNSQFAQVVFLTGLNSKSRVVGIDLNSAQNRNAMNDTNRILFCSGMFSFGKTNTFAESVFKDINAAFTNYQEHAEELEARKAQPVVSPADELKKFKELLDMGAITQEEYDAKKKQLLGL